MSYRYAVLQDPKSRKCVIHELALEYPKRWEGYTFCGFAKTKRQAYAIVDYTHEMDR